MPNPAVRHKPRNTAGSLRAQRDPPRLTKEAVIAAFRTSGLLEAATRVFGERGFECATMDMIAGAAGVAKGTVYFYYPSKKSIYDAALAAGLGELDERTGRAIAAAPAFRDVIPAFIVTRAEYFLERPDFFRMYIAEIARQVTDIQARPDGFASLVKRQTGRLETSVAGAVARREIRRVDPASTALAIFDLTRGLVARRLVSRAGGRFAEDVSFLADLIWRGLAEAPQPTGRQGRAGAREGKKR